MNPTNLIDQGKTHFERKEFDKALACLNAYILAEPRAGVGYYNRGVIFRKQGKFDNALADFENAIRIAPRSPDAYLGRGDVHRDRKQYAQAVTDYTKAISLNPRQRESYALRAEALFNLKRLEEALADCNRGLQLDHEEPILYNLRGMTYLALNLHQKALDDINIAIRIGSKDPRVYFTRSITYWQLLEHGKALADLTRAVDLATTKEGQREFYVRRADLNLITGHPLRSLADYLRHEQRRPDHRAAYFLRPLFFWLRRLLSLLAIRGKCLLGSLTIKPLFICFERPFLALMFWRLSKAGIFVRHDWRYPRLRVSYLVDPGTSPADPELYQRAVDCFLAACDAPDAPEALKKTRKSMGGLITINLDTSRKKYLKLLRKNIKGYRIPILGRLLKTKDLTACTQYLAEELVWIWYFRTDVYSPRFCMTRTKDLMPRAWLFCRQQKPEIDAYLERFCKAKLAEYAKSPEKPRAWPYYGVPEISSLER